MVTVKVPALPSVKVVLSAEVMAGAPSTVRVKDWVASGAKPLVASMVTGRCPSCRPPGCRPGWPCRHRCRLKVTPVGRPPDSDSDAVGEPVVVTVKDPALPSVKVVLSAEVMAGGPSTVRVKDWVASGAHPVGGVDGERCRRPPRSGCRPGWPCRPRCRRRSPRRERAGLRQGRCGRAVVVTVNGPGTAFGEGGAVARGDGRAHRPR